MSVKRQKELSAEDIVLVHHELKGLEREEKERK
jgi:hypothetical protein